MVAEFKTTSSVFVTAVFNDSINITQRGPSEFKDCTVDFEPSKGDIATRKEITEFIVDFDIAEISKCEILPRKEATCYDEPKLLREPKYYPLAMNASKFTALRLRLPPCGHDSANTRSNYELHIFLELRYLAKYRSGIVHKEK